MAVMLPEKPRQEPEAFPDLAFFGGIFLYTFRTAPDQILILFFILFGELTAV